jgi:CHAD domain-containing protein/lipid-A-disaccharide synthase-like uncharacterized protein
MSGINKMEIEYKFSVKDSETFDFLKDLSAAGDYQIKDKSKPIFKDIFYDTPDLLLFSLGVYLRKRQEAGREEAVWTLKQAGVSEEDVCRRREMIQFLPLESAAEEISDPAFKKMLTGILGGAALTEILIQEQDRVFKTVYKKGLTEENADLTLPENRLGELSVDLVSLKFFEQKHIFTELEIELAEGTEKQLQEFIDTLKALPELREKIKINRFSKFERGMVLYFNRDKIEGNAIHGIEKKSCFTDVEDIGNEERVFESADSGFLLPREKASLLQISEKEYTADPTDYFGGTGFLYQDEKTRDLFSRRAAVLLSIDCGMTAAFAAQAFGLTAAEIEEMRNDFDRTRLGVFPFVFETEENGGIGGKDIYTYQKPLDGVKTWTAGELARYYGVNTARARLRTNAACKLFDGLAAEYYFSENDKKILIAAARLFEIGEGISAEKNINIASDIVLTHPIEKFALNEIKTLALIFVLRGIKNPAPEKVREAIRKSGFFTPPVYQKKAMILAAVLETAGKDKESAAPKKNLAGMIWNLAAEYAAGHEEEEKEPAKPDLKIKAADMTAAAAEKIFAAGLLEIGKAKPGVIAAEDIEDVHDMRVALRKMRSFALIFKNFLNTEWLAETESGIKKTLSKLGELRDLDVLLEKTDEWRKTEKIGREKMAVFYDFVSDDRNKSHAEVVEYLESEEYADFMTGLKETFDSGLYLGVAGINKKGDVAPVRICDVLPAILYEKAADITAYHEWMDGPFIHVDKLHRLRIAAKNFRYTLDFFKECLGEAAGQLIQEFKELQDILGDFHDAAVAAEVIGAYRERIEKEKASGEAKTGETEMSLDTLEKYKNGREEEMERLLSAFQLKWEKMDRRFFSERIAKIIEEADF